MWINTPDWIIKWPIISNWKTKWIYEVQDKKWLVIMKNNDNISADDWARMEEWEWKAELSTTITANVFEYLNSIWIKTHFRERLNSDEILVEKCKMAPIECVFRFVATWSYIKRDKAMRWEDAIDDGTVLDSPIIELYYKNDVILGDWLIISDPMIKLWDDWLPVLNDNWGFVLLNPKTWERLEFNQIREPGTDEKISIDDFWIESFNIKQISDQLLEQTKEVWEWVRSMYAQVWVDTFDWKVEFWFNEHDELVLADVIDWDSCRLRIPYIIEWDDGKNYLVWDFLPWELAGIWGHSEEYFSKMATLPKWMWIRKVILAEGLDKQWYREWGSVEDTLVRYRKLAEKSWEALSKAGVRPEDKIIKKVRENIEELV